MSLRAAAVRFFAALRAGWRAACERWRTGPAAPEVERKGACWFDLPPGTFAPPGDEEAEVWDARHFRQGWPR